MRFSLIGLTAVTAGLFYFLAPLNAQQQGTSVCTTPVSRENYKAVAAGWGGDHSWMQQHEDINRLAESSNPRLVFLGDSITQSWGGPGRNVWKPVKPLWRRHFRKYDAVNFGISGDGTQHLLWRLQNGNLEGISPEVVVLLIGTNNIPDSESSEIVDGIRAVCREIMQKLPETRILLTGLFPREEPGHPYRQKVEEINRAIHAFEDGDQILYMDVGSLFLNEDGTINPCLMAEDKLHLKPAGYRVWARALSRPLGDLLR